MSQNRKWVELTDWQISAVAESIRWAQKDFRLEHASAERLMELLCHSDKIKIHVKADRC